MLYLPDQVKVVSPSEPCNNSHFMIRCHILILYTLWVCFFVCCSRTQSPYFGIKIVDRVSGRAVPLVELETVNALSYFTDNGGFIAINEPDFMGETIYFQIESAGYRYSTDASGRQGVSLAIQPGKDTTLYMQREQIAERLYRLTGSGQYVHSQALGHMASLTSRKIKGGVLGQDSNLAIPYRGKIFWVWGDTFLPDKYQGNFAVSAAWTGGSSPWKLVHKPGN